MESKETRTLLFFKHNASTNFSLFFERKTRGSDFWTIKIYFVDHRTIRKTGCEGEWSEMEHWKILHSAKDLKQKGRNVERSADVTGSGRHFCGGELNYRMWEKALIGDDGSQVRRKGLLVVLRTNLERLEPMPFRTQLHMIQHRKTESKTDSHCESVLFRNLFPAQSNKPLRRALFLDGRCFDKVL